MTFGVLGWQIGKTRDWQPQRDANCGDPKAELGTTSGSGQV